MELVEQLAKRVIIRPTYLLLLLHTHTLPSTTRHTFIYILLDYSSESPKERDHWEDQGGKMESEWILGRLAWGGGIGFNWLRTGTGGGLL
jgi:hypothetical protein